jgi:mannose-6-phosphate isomerase-like protein (cupin superfamily)
MPVMKNYMIARLDDVDPQQCPCGTTRRAFVDPDNEAATMHLVEISQDSRVHYHKKLTEIYLVLEGEGHVQLDDDKVPVQPKTAIMIRPGCRHRAVGELKVLVVAIPAFDPADEWFD